MCKVKMTEKQNNNKMEMAGKIENDLHKKLVVKKSMTEYN